MGPAPFATATKADIKSMTPPQFIHYIEDQFATMFRANQARKNYIRGAIKHKTDATVLGDHEHISKVEKQGLKL